MNVQKQKRKRHTAEEKVAILLEHLTGNVPIPEVCERHGISADTFDRWQEVCIAKNDGVLIRLRVHQAFSGETRYELKECMKIGERRVCLLTTDTSRSSEYGHTRMLSACEIDAAEVERMQNDLARTPICVGPSEAMGLDATSYSLEINRWMSSVQFTWWKELPEQWANLAPLVRFMISGKLPEMSV